MLGILHGILDAPDKLVELFLANLFLPVQRTPRRVHAAQGVADFNQGDCAHGFTSFGPEHSPAHIRAQRASTMHAG